MLPLLGVTVPDGTPASAVRAAERPAWLALLAGVVSAFVIIVWTLGRSHIIGAPDPFLDSGAVAAFVALTGVAPSLQQRAQLAILAGNVDAVHRRLDHAGAPSARDGASG